MTNCFRKFRVIIVTLAIAGASAATAHAQLRIINYNTAGVNNISAMTTVVAAMNSEVVNGVAKPIDVIMLQELSSGDMASMLSILNGQGASTYFAGNVGTTTGAGGVGLIYRSESVQLIGQQQVLGTSSNGAARGVMRYQLRPAGYNAASDFYAYVSHYKASDSSADASRRNVEAAAIRADSNALGEGAHVIYAGDFNIYRSSEPMWATLTAGGNGQAFDPVNQVGSWHDSAAFLGVHTQNPAGSGFVGGGMDDRFDWQMTTAEMLDDEGLSIIPGSYHAFGNNGTHSLNGHINTGTGASPTVLNALGSASDHLPVFAQYQVPAKMDVAVSAVPPQIIVGASFNAAVTVSNVAGDGVLVAAPIGADELDYAINASGGASGAQNGSDQAFGMGNSHQFALDTTVAGAKLASFVTTATSPQVPNPVRNDVVSFDVLDHANASFAGGGDLNSLTIDFGSLQVGSGIYQSPFDVFNLVATAGFTAPLDLLTIASSGDTGVLGTNLSLFDNLAAGGAQSFLASIDTASIGSFSATYLLSLSDDTNLSGALGGQQLALNLLGTVANVPEPTAMFLALATLFLVPRRAFRRGAGATK